jgi:hypothetical protein
MEGALRERLATVELHHYRGRDLCGGYASDRLVRQGFSLVEARRLPAALRYLASALFTALAAYSAGPGLAILWISLAMFFLFSRLQRSGH